MECKNNEAILYGERQGCIAVMKLFLNGDLQLHRRPVRIDNIISFREGFAVDVEGAIGGFDSKRPLASLDTATRRPADPKARRSAFPVQARWHEFADAVSSSRDGHTVRASSASTMGAEMRSIQPMPPAGSRHCTVTGWNWHLCRQRASSAWILRRSAGFCQPRRWPRGPR